jgi:3-oxoacyl-[acyl-carrier-protein] synthase-3
MKRTKIAEIATYLPAQRIDNETLVKRIQAQQQTCLTADMLERLFGIKERRFAAKEEQVSDLATKAALPIVEKIGREHIDLLIFAAACSDLIEPATCNIIQNKLGLTCPAMDIKNACNSFVSAIHTATAFIQSGIYNNVLVVNGEKLSNAINYKIRDINHLKRSLAAFSLGDAGAAALITASEDESGFYHQDFLTVGKHWDLCTIQGGGSMYPHDVDKNYFEGKTAALKDVILNEAKDFIQQSFQRANWCPSTVQHLVTHQVSMPTFPVVAEAIGIPVERSISTFEYYGNNAAASIPLAINQAIENNIFKKGDKIAIVGLAAGVSVSLQLVVW